MTVSKKADAAINARCEKALAVIKQNGPMSNADLAAWVGCSSAQMAGAMKRLLKAGIVTVYASNKRDESSNAIMVWSLASTDAPKQDRGAILQKPCVCCGKQIVYSPKDGRTHFDRRRTCSRSCAGKLRKGVVMPVEGGTSVEEAMQALGLATQKWRVAA